MKQFFITAFLLYACLAEAQQTRKYTTANAHSHNDYEQARPFHLAFENGYGSIEADIYLKDGKLLVAHEPKNLDENRNLENLYLQPLEEVITRKTSLQLLIDIKTEAKSTLTALIELLQQHPSIIHHKKIRIVISGNRPSPEEMKSYPSYIFFDGRITEQYDEAALKKIALISESFLKFSKWDGVGEMKASEQSTIKALIEKIHALKKPIRFWATPDTKNSWQFFMESGVDFINTDKLVELREFLKGKRKTVNQ